MRGFSALISATGGLLGGVLGATFVVVVTSAIKDLLAFIIRQNRVVLVLAPLIGIALAVVVLHRVAHGVAVQRLDEAQGEVPRGFGAWLRFPSNVVRADLTADVVRTAGAEERFPWRLAPIRAAAILVTVGLGAPMGTESPAAHLGVATGAALDRAGPRWSRLARPAALGGGAAGIAALMGLPLVGVVFMIELGRRNRAAVTLDRLLAAGCGAMVGWGINQLLGLNLIRLVVPTIAPRDLVQALATAALVGCLSGALCSLTGSLIYRARTWRAGVVTRFAIGGSVIVACALAIGRLATPAAALGPGGGAVAWAETTNASSWTLLAVALLRAVATTAAVAAGGCGGVFVPFLSIGDLCGRALAPGLGATNQLTAAAGAAGGIAGGYRLPLTAIAMVVTIGGPTAARITCGATVVFAVASGVLVAFTLDRFGARR